MKELFHHGYVHTMDGEQVVSAFLVEDGVIRAIGAYEQLRSEYPGCVCVDLGGKCVIPGFHDSHQHFLCYAIDKEKIDFFNARGLEDMARLTRAYIEKHQIPKGQWIQGGGWNENNFVDRQLPTREDLDRFCPDHPAIFTRACCSVAVANTLALKMAGIFENPPTMEDGRIVLDSAGTPTGMLEERARFLLYDRIPNVGKEHLKELILAYQEDLLKCGLTTVQTDDFKLWDASIDDILTAYRELDREGRLKVRFHQQLRFVNHTELDHFLEQGLKTGDGTDFFKIGAYKLLPDGSLGGKTAALREPYVGDPENRGILTYHTQDLYSLLEKAHTHGLQLAMHAIGDRTMDQVLGCYERLAREYPREDPRFRIIHCQITTQDILESFARMGVLADIQPLFIRADMEIAETLLGPERTRWSYNWRTMHQMGIHVSGSSDAPVESFDPLSAIYCATTSKNLLGQPDGGWMPEQRLSMQEAVALYTTGSAYTVFEEGYKGKLAPGYLADFLVLSEDLFTIPEERLLEVKVERTYVGGQLAFENRP